MALSLSAGACTETTVAPAVQGPESGLCLYPRACYVVSRCDCKSGLAGCRVISAAEMGLGVFVPYPSAPMPTDPGVICQVATDGMAGVVCAQPEALCPPQTDGGAGDMPAPVDGGVSG